MAATRYRYADGMRDDAEVPSLRSPPMAVVPPGLTGRAFQAGGSDDHHDPRAADPEPRLTRNAAAARDLPLPGVPASPPAPSPAATIASALTVEGASRLQTVALATQPSGHRIPASPHTLRIQLNPTHLGVVDATLKMSGMQLTVEIRVESREAYERLSSDGHVIEKALRGQGFEAAQVTIVHSPVVSSAPGRPDAAPFQPSPPTTHDNAADPGSSSGGRGSQGQQEERHAGNRHAPQAPLSHRDGSGGGGSLYI